MGRKNAKKPLPRLVNSLEEALAGIGVNYKSVPKYPGLAKRLGRVHVFYVDQSDEAHPMFGFSKFVGYQGLSPQKYLDEYQELDGRNTEVALQPWFVELTPSSPGYDALFDQLVTWMEQYGQRPRGGKKQKVRLMVVRPEFRRQDNSSGEDRRLLELMIAAADILPANQRLELRSAL